MFAMSQLAFSATFILIQVSLMNSFLTEQEFHRIYVSFFVKHLQHIFILFQK
jgi:hypothetical protein